MFKLIIITPEKQFDPIDVSIVNLWTTEGQIGMLPNHMSYVVNVVEGDMTFDDQNKVRHTYRIGKGTFYFHQNEAQLLTDFAIEA